MPRPSGNFWIAEYDPDARFGYHWRPMLQMEGIVDCFDTYFETQRACEEFIRDEILGAGARFEAISNVGVIAGEVVPSPEKVAQLFAEVNDRPGHIGPA